MGCQAGRVGFVLSLVVLAPLVWALAGTPAADAVAGWAQENAPAVATTAAVPSTALLAAVVAGSVLGGGRARVATTHVSTVAHELGHGVTAGLLGGELMSVHMRPDGSGVAYTRMRRNRPVAGFLVAAAGYVAPGVVAVASMQAVLAGLTGLWLAYLVTVAALALVLTVRSWWGALVVLGLGALGWAVLALAPPSAAPLLLAGLAGVLAGGGVVDAVGQWRMRATDTSTDAASMAAQTRLAAGIFAGFHLLAAVGLASAAVTLPIWR